MVRPTGLEPVTSGSVGRCSIQLSHGRASRVNIPKEAPERKTRHAGRESAAEGTLSRGGRIWPPSRPVSRELKLPEGDSRMKRESLLMLVAGVVLGAVLGFIATREYYVRKITAQPPGPGPGPAAPGGMPDQGPQGFDAGQHDAMLAQIKADLEKDPNNAEKRINLGNIYYDRQKFSEAAGFYEQALKIQPDNTDVIVDLGICYRNTDRPDEALKMFDRALAIQPEKKQALFNKAVVYAFDKRDKPKAMEILAGLKAKYPDDPLVKELEQALKK